MLVTDPRSRASLHEILTHPWLLKGYSSPPENYLPAREPLALPLDPLVIQGMTGFEFGNPELITNQLNKLIESEEYQNAIKQSTRETPLTSANPEKRKGFGFDFYKRRSSTSSKDTLTNISSEVLTPYAQADPINAYHPLISIYYLVREKHQRARQGVVTGTQLSLPSSDVGNLAHIAIPKQPEAAHTSETSYELKGEPSPAGGRTRPRARTHGDEEVSEAMKKVNIGGHSPQPVPQIPKEEPAAKKESTVGSMLRRLSTRRHNSNRGDADTGKIPGAPTLSLPPSDNSASMRKSLSMRRSGETARANLSPNISQGGQPDLLTPPTSADGPNSNRSSKLGRSTSVSEVDWRRKNSRQKRFEDSVGTAGSDITRSKREPGDADAQTSSTGKMSTVRAKSVGHARKQSALRRSRKEGAGASGFGTAATELLEEDDAADATTSAGSGDGGASTTPSADYVKPVFLKGLFSVSTTSTKPPSEIRRDIIRVLHQLGVSYKEIKGGFSCVHRPSIDLKSVVDAPQAPEPTNMVSTSHRRKLSFGGGGGGQPVSKSATRRNRADTSYTNSDASNESIHDGVLGGSLILQFEIYIVKVPLLALHGIQFKSVNKTNTWQYKSLASRILSELRL